MPNCLLPAVINKCPAYAGHLFYGNKPIVQKVSAAIGYAVLILSKAAIVNNIKITSNETDRLFCVLRSLVVRLEPVSITSTRLK